MYVTYSLDVTVMRLCVLGTCAILAGIVLKNLSPELGNKRQMHLFRTFVLAFLASVLFDLVWESSLATFLVPSTFMLCTFFTITGALFAIQSLAWFLSLASLYKPELFDNGRVIIASALPVIIMILACIYGSYTFISGADDGFLFMGIIYPIMTAIHMIYAGITAVWSLVKAARASSKSSRNNYLAFAGVSIPITLGQMVQLLIPPALAGYIASAFVATLAFIVLQKRQLFDDVLTGLNNRRRCDLFLAARIKSKTPGREFGVYLIDVDKFKNVNDEQGHVEGDHALRVVADGIRRAAAATHAFAARWGGDEFVLALPQGTTVAAGEIETLVSDSIRAVCHEQNIKYPLTVSIGSTQVDSNMKSVQAIIENADAALYQQKAERAL